VFSRAERRTRLTEHVLADDRYSSHRALVHALRDGNAAKAEEIVMKDARGGLDDLLRAPQTGRG
jgi:DNA-binding GntR family transcriptional regulator